MAFKIMGMKQKREKCKSKSITLTEKNLLLILRDLFGDKVLHRFLFMGI